MLQGIIRILITSGGQRLPPKTFQGLDRFAFQIPTLHVSSRSAPAPQAGPISRYLLPAGCAATAQDTTQCSGSLALTWNAGFLKIHIFNGFKDLQGLVHAVELCWNLQVMNLIILIFKRNVVRSRPIAPARLLRYCAFLLQSPPANQDNQDLLKFWCDLRYDVAPSHRLDANPP